MTQPNAQIEIRGEWPLIGGNPVLYLNCLRDVKTARSTYPAGSIPRAEGKLGFAHFIATHGGRTVRTIAAIGGGTIRWGNAPKGQTVTAFLEQLGPGYYFCKPNRGGNGEGAFRLGISSEGASVDGKVFPIAKIAEQLASADYLVQDWLVPVQHPDIARFNPNVINTLRLVTFAVEGRAKPIAATMRLGSGRRAVDNWSAGGVAVPIALERFTLGEFGVLKDGLTIVAVHPETGIAFRDQAVPHGKAAAAMACELHDRLAIASLGWDIALLKEGPCILESNARWDTHLAAQLNPDFLRAFLAFHLAEKPEASVRLEFDGRFTDLDRVRVFLCGAAGNGLASGRVEQFSEARLTLVLSGTNRGLKSAIAWIGKAAGSAGITTMRPLQCQERLPPGLDIAATFSA